MKLALATLVASSAFAAASWLAPARLHDVPELVVRGLPPDARAFARIDVFAARGKIADAERVADAAIAGRDQAVIDAVRLHLAEATHTRAELAAWIATTPADARTAGFAALRLGNADEAVRLLAHQPADAAVLAARADAFHLLDLPDDEAAALAALDPLVADRPLRARLARQRARALAAAPIP